MRGGSNTPFVKDPLGAINRFVNYKFGADIGKRSTWGFPMSGSSSTSARPTQTSISSGSLLTDPVGAVARIANSMGIKTPEVTPSKSKGSSGGNVFSQLMGAAKQRFQGKEKPKGEKGFFENLQSATFRDAGNIYLKQMMGGLGGPISERDLSGESQQELQKAIQRAKKRTGSEIAKAEAKIKELRAMGAKDGNPALETQKSFLKKLKSGGVRVQYTDYAENGKMTESAKNAKNILGQFWAYGRSEKEGGGYRVEDKYNFDKMKDPMKVLTGSGSSIQQRLQALYQMNPFASKATGGDVDMVLGGKRTKQDSASLIAKKSIMSSPLGILGGLVANANKPPQVGRTRPRTRPVKPPSSQKPKVVYGPPAPKKRNKRGGGTTQSTPRFSATTKGMRSKQETLGLMR
jgi:hypothetical protein